MKNPLFSFMIAPALDLAARISDSTDLGDPKFTEAGDDSIRPFRINVPDELLTHLRLRLAATRWPEANGISDQSRLMHLHEVQDLVHYWRTRYDWRKAEEKLNAWPQFTTTIDGVDIQFLQIRSRHPNAMPLIMTHGWPGSVFELLRVVGPLTDPTAYGGRAEDAFDLVLPSLPGYSFLAKPQGIIWNSDHVAQIASAWAELMRRLGYKHYVSQGGDWGAIVSHTMARQAPEGLLGIHVNMPAVVPKNVAEALSRSGAAPSGLSDAERTAFEQLDAFYKKGTGYSAMMMIRPETLSYGLADTPAGQAAWIYDKYAGCGAQKGVLAWDEMLDDVTLYWLTNSGTSSARLYWGNLDNVFDAVNISIPVAVTVFPGEIYCAPRSWAERNYQKLIYFQEAEKGGHLAVWEQPEIFASEIRAAFRSLRHLGH